jgi:uncharacterized protein YjbI with pentapeptide repeats
MRTGRTDGHDGSAAVAPHGDSENTGADNLELSGSAAESDDRSGLGEGGSLAETIRTSCRKGAEGRPFSMDLRGVNLVGEDLSGLDFSGYDLSGANLTNADLSGSNLGWAKLRDAYLCKARLDDCEFVGADLQAANLNECCGERTGFGATNLTGASLISADLRKATLSEARLCRADLRAADLSGSNIRSADLAGANLTRATVRDADLEQSNCLGASFEIADLRRSRLFGIRNYTSASWIGTDIRDIDLRGAYLIRRFIADENYLYEFRSRSRYHKTLYWLWWATSDCGRSLARWTFWISVVTAVFAILYTLVGVDFGPNRTVFSPLYYSIVTLTTLGYGDVVPATGPAQIVAAAEAILGYVSLGGFLSILANKMARRAD